MFGAIVVFDIPDVIKVGTHIAALAVKGTVPSFRIIAGIEDALSVTVIDIKGDQFEITALYTEQVIQPVAVGREGIGYKNERIAGDLEAMVYGVPIATPVGSHQGDAVFTGPGKAAHQVF